LQHSICHSSVGDADKSGRSDRAASKACARIDGSKCSSTVFRSKQQHKCGTRRQNYTGRSGDDPTYNLAAARRNVLPQIVAKAGLGRTYACIITCANGKNGIKLADGASRIRNLNVTSRSGSADSNSNRPGSVACVRANRLSAGSQLDQAIEDSAGGAV